MSRQVPWNEPIYMEFSRLAMLSPLEREVLRMRIMNYTVVQTSLELRISVSSVNRIVKRLKTKYDKVQQYSDVLPKRRYSAQETYMDEH